MKINIEIETEEDVDLMQKVVMKLASGFIEGPAPEVKKPVMSERSTPAPEKTAQSASSLLGDPDKTPDVDLSDPPVETKSEAQIAKEYRAQLKLQLKGLNVEFSEKAATTTLEKKLAEAQTGVGATVTGPSAAQSSASSLLGGDEPPADITPGAGAGSLLDESPGPSAASKSPESDAVRLALRKLVTKIGKDGALAVLKLTTQAEEVVHADPSTFPVFHATCDDIGSKIDVMIAANTHTAEQAAEVINSKLKAKS